MKTINSTYFLIFLLSTVSLSCTKDDEPRTSNEVSTVFEEESFVEISSLNGVSVNTTSFTDGVTSGSNTIDSSNQANAELSSFDTGIAAPIDNTVLLQASLNSVAVVLTDGTEVPPFFAGGSVGSIVDAGDGVLRQDFRYNFTYPSNANPIPINTINRIRLVYSIDYTSSGDLIHTKTFTHTIFFN